MRRGLIGLVVVLSACVTLPRPSPPVVAPPITIPPIVVPELPPVVVEPTLAWPGADGAWLEDLRDTSRVDRDAVGDAVVIHRGVLIAKLGNWNARSGLWSSSVRTWRTLMTLQAIHEGRIPREALEQDAGRPFPQGIHLIHVLSRTSNARPPGTSWRYSGGDHWPWQHQVIERMTGESREATTLRLVSAVGASLTWDRDPDDGTQRVDGSPYEMAKLGLLMLREGLWSDHRVFDADLWRMAIGGGLHGDGAPMHTEGWQVHLVRDGGRHTELGARPPMSHVSDRAYFAAGGTNRGYVFVDPETDLVVARVRRAGVSVDQFLPNLLDALEIR